jgi:hypothetical protein
MRAPQYGHSKGKRRGSQTALPAKPRLWRALGLRGPNEPLPRHRIRYQQRKEVIYDDGTVGARVTLHLWHKSAKAMGGKGPTVMKRYAELENSHRGGG